MSLLVVYVVMVIFGQAAGVLLSLFIDRYTHDGLALIIFFVIFFGIFVLCWPLAVRLTKPKDAPV
jgi:hypothetical protein